jgi:hypothetical protein
MAICRAQSGNKVQTTIFGIVMCVLVGIPGITTRTTAQETDTYDHPWYVFVQHDVDSEGRNELLFVDMLTGDEVTIISSGERYTITERGVIFFDPDNNRVMLATPDGALREHPFVRTEADTHRIEWVISDDGSHIAWTVTLFDPQNRLTTSTSVANIDGTERRVVLTDVDTSESNMRVFPVGFSEDNNILYIDTAHLDGITEYIAFAQYVSIFALNLKTNEQVLMPGEQGNCICGADLAAGRFLRLRLTRDLKFDLYILDLVDGMETVIPALRLEDHDYTTAGDVLISSDATRAVYALSEIGDFGATQQPIRTVFVLVDLEAMSQETLTNPLTTFVRPVGWTDDNSAIIFTSPTQDGTWKISLSDGRLDRIAESTYIGTLRG